MFFSADKAIRDLGLPQTPAETALADAVTWFADHGYAPHVPRMSLGNLSASLDAQEPLELLLRVPLPAARPARGHLRLYAFCRIVDDAVDLGQDRTAQRAELARWRDEIARVYEGRAEHPAAQRLQVALRQFPIPRSALEEIIAGVEMDLDHPTYETWDALYPYCYRVASAVGLCCIEIFGYSDPRAREYAVNLGIALQLTNIMRDVQVDAPRGAHLPAAGRPPALRGHRGGPGRGPLHARSSSGSWRFEAGARPRLLPARVGRAAPRRRAPPVRGRDHGTHLLRAPPRRSRRAASSVFDAPRHAPGPAQRRHRPPLLGSPRAPAQRMAA